ARVAAHGGPGRPAGAGGLVRGGVVAAGGHGGAAVGGQHHQPVPLGYHEDRLAGTGGGGFHGLGEGPEGVGVGLAAVTGAGRRPRRGDDDPGRRVQPSPVQVSGHRAGGVGLPGEQHAQDGGADALIGGVQGAGAFRVEGEQGDRGVEGIPLGGAEGGGRADGEGGAGAPAGAQGVQFDPVVVLGAGDVGGGGRGTFA